MPNAPRNRFQTARKIFTDHYDRLRDVPPNERVPYLSDIILRVTGSYLKPLAQPSDVPMSSKQKMQAICGHLFGVISSTTVTILILVWIALTGQQNMLLMLGDWIPFAEDKAHLISLTFVALASIMVDSMYIVNMLIGDKRDHYWLMLRYLFQRDPKLLVIPTHDAQQVKYWRETYAIFVLVQVSSQFANMFFILCVG